MKLVLTLMTLCAIVAGCSSTLSFKTPLARFQSPETSGKAGGFGLGAYAHNDIEIVVIDNIEALPPRKKDPRIIIESVWPTKNRYGADRTFFSGKSISLNGHVGVAQKVDIIANTGDDAPFNVGAKVQILGESQIESAKGNFSLSLAAMVGRGKEESDEKDYTLDFEQDDLTETKRINSEAVTTQYDFSVIAGYRLADNVLLYGGPFIQYYDVDYEVNAINEGTKYVFSDSGHNLGHHLGFMLEIGQERKVNLKVEYDFAKVEWGTSKRDANIVAFGISTSL